MAEGQVVTDGQAPDVDPVLVTWPTTPRTINHPNGIGWSMDLDAMPAFKASQGVLEDLIAWSNQRTYENRILEEMAAIVKDRGPGGPGLLLIRYPGGEMVLMESQWIPSGTLIYSMQPDQPDLMVKIDPDDQRVIYYRQRIQSLF